MEAHGDNKNQLALKMGIGASAVSKLFNGRHSFNLNSVIKVAECYGVSIDWLLGRESENEKVLREVIERQGKELEKYRETAELFRKQLLEQTKITHVKK